MSKEQATTKRLDLVGEWIAWQNLPKPDVKLDESAEQVLGAVIDQQTKTICNAWACIEELVKVVNLATERALISGDANEHAAILEVLKIPVSYEIFKNSYRDCLFLSMVTDRFLQVIDGGVTEAIYEKAFKDAERFMFPNDEMKGSA